MPSRPRKNRSRSRSKRHRSPGRRSRSRRLRGGSKKVAEVVANEGGGRGLSANDWITGAAVLGGTGAMLYANTQRKRANKAEEERDRHLKNVLKLENELRSQLDLLDELRKRHQILVNEAAKLRQEATDEASRVRVAISFLSSKKESDKKKAAKDLKEAQRTLEASEQKAAAAESRATATSAQVEQATAEIARKESELATIKQEMEAAEARARTEREARQSAERAQAQEAVAALNRRKEETKVNRTAIQENINKILRARFTEEELANTIPEYVQRYFNASDGLSSMINDDTINNSETLNGFVSLKQQACSSIDPLCGVSYVLTSFLSGDELSNYRMLTSELDIIDFDLFVRKYNELPLSDRPQITIEDTLQTPFFLRLKYFLQK